jgi:hypothetical protein
MNEKSDVSEKKKIAFMLETIKDILGINKNTSR